MPDQCGSAQKGMDEPTTPSVLLLSYYLSPTALNFGDRTRTGAFAVV